MQFTSTLLVALLAVSPFPTRTTAQKVSNLRGGGHGVMGGGFTAHTATPPTRRTLEEEGCQNLGKACYREISDVSRRSKYVSYSEYFAKYVSPNRGLRRHRRGRSHTTTGTLGARCSSYITPAGTREGPFEYSSTDSSSGLI